MVHEPVDVSGLCSLPLSGCTSSVESQPRVWCRAGGGVARGLYPLARRAPNEVIAAARLAAGLPRRWSFFAMVLFAQAPAAGR